MQLETPPCPCVLFIPFFSFLMIGGGGRKDNRRKEEKLKKEGISESGVRAFCQKKFSPFMFPMWSPTRQVAVTRGMDVSKQVGEKTNVRIAIKNPDCWHSSRPKEGYKPRPKEAAPTEEKVRYSELNILRCVYPLQFKCLSYFYIYSHLAEDIFQGESAWSDLLHSSLSSVRLGFKKHFFYSTKSVLEI